MIVFPDTEAISLISTVGLSETRGTMTWHRVMDHPLPPWVVHIPGDVIPLQDLSSARETRRCRLQGRSRQFVKHHELTGGEPAPVGNRDRERALLTVGRQILGCAVIGAGPAGRADDDDRLCVLRIGARINWRQDTVGASDDLRGSRTSAICLLQNRYTGA